MRTTVDKNGKEKECILKKMAQFQCAVRFPDKIVCTPIIRLFKMCEGEPTVEMLPLEQGIIEKIPSPSTSPAFRDKTLAFERQILLELKMNS